MSKPRLDDMILGDNSPVDGAAPESDTVEVAAAPEQEAGPVDEKAKLNPGSGGCYRFEDGQYIKIEE